MEFWNLMRILRVRWLVLVPMLVLTATLATLVLVSSPRAYTSQAVLVLSGAPTGGTTYARGYVPKPSNPLLLNSRGVALACAMLVQGMQTEEFAARVLQPGDLRTTMTVTNSSDGTEQVVTGPFVQLAAESNSADDAQALLQRTVAAARDELRTMQEGLGAPPSTFITLNEVVSPAAPEPARSPGARAAAAIAGLGTLLSILAAISTQGLVEGRLRAGRRAEGSHALRDHALRDEDNTLVEDADQVRV
jgi:hypothetical protein